MENHRIRKARAIFKTSLIRFQNWKPLHLCWLFKKLGIPIPKYLIGAGSDYTLSGSRIANATRTWQANEDIDVTGWTKANAFIFAAAVESAAHGAASGTLQLRWRDVNDAGSFAALAATGELNWTGTTDLVNGNAVATGEKGCTSILTTYVEGIEREGANDVVKDLGTDEWTEHHWAIDGSGADDGHKYEFEIYDVTEGAAVGTCLADITIETQGVAKYATLSDSVGITDSISNKRNIIKSISDSLGITDTITTARNIKKSISDTLALSDALDAVIKKFVSLADTVGITSEGVETGGLFVIDGENAGSTPWEFDSIFNEGSCVFSLQAGAKNNGDYGYSAVFDGVNNGCYALKAFASSKDEVYVRGYVYIDSGLTIPAWGMVALLRFRDGTTDLCIVRARRDEGTSGVPTTWYCAGQDLTVVNSATNFSLGVWHRIEIHWKKGSGADGGAQVRIDGDSILNEFDNDLTAYSADDIMVGTQYDAIPALNDFIYFDDIKADTSYIGAYSAGGGITTKKGAVRSISDNVGLTDVLSRIAAFSRSISDTIGLTDVLTGVKQGAAKFASLSDTVGITDLLSTTVFKLASLADTLGITDSISRIKRAARSILNTLGLTDTRSTAREIKKQIADTAGITDTTQASAGRFASLADSLGITDSISTALIKTAQLADTLGLADVLTRAFRGVRIITDTLGLTDSLSRVGIFVRSISDTLGITDVLTGLRKRLRSIADALGITDVLSRTVEQAPTELKRAYISFAPTGAQISFDPTGAYVAFRATGAIIIFEEDIIMSVPYANELSSFARKITFKTVDGETVTPSAITWTLSDEDGNIINSRKQVPVGSPASTITIMMSGDDLAIITPTKLKRILTIEATYDPGTGAVPLKDEYTFRIRPLVNVPVPA